VRGGSKLRAWGRGIIIKEEMASLTHRCHEMAPLTHRCHSAYHRSVPDRGSGSCIHTARRSWRQHDVALRTSRGCSHWRRSHCGGTASVESPDRAPAVAGRSCSAPCQRDGSCGWAWGCAWPMISQTAQANPPPPPSASIPLGSHRWLCAT